MSMELTHSHMQPTHAEIMYCDLLTQSIIASLEETFVNSAAGPTLIPLSILPPKPTLITRLVKDLASLLRISTGRRTSSK